MSPDQNTRLALDKKCELTNSMEDFLTNMCRSVCNALCFFGQHTIQQLNQSGCGVL